MEVSSGGGRRYSTSTWRWRCYDLWGCVGKQSNGCDMGTFGVAGSSVQSMKKQSKPLHTSRTSESISYCLLDRERVGLSLFAF